MNEFLTWEIIGTYTGAALAVTILTQLLKHAFPKPDPKWFAIALGMLLMMGYTVLYLKDYSVSGIILAILNGGVVALAGIGTFEGTKSVSKIFKQDSR